jgi:hypothetical protein
MAQHQALDEGLGRGAAAAALAHGNHPRLWAVRQHCRVDQSSIITTWPGPGAYSLEGEQFGVARAGANQPDFRIHRVFLVDRCHSTLEQGEQQDQVEQQGQQRQVRQTFSGSRSSSGRGRSGSAWRSPRSSSSNHCSAVSKRWAGSRPGLLQVALQPFGQVGPVAAGLIAR